MKDDIQIVIAGPGSGKTHNMIGEILKILPEVENNPHRICAIITYTNAATEEIKERLEKKINIPKNIFIGTSHSFLIQFIIEPYSYLFSNVPLEKNYIDSVSLPNEFKEWISRKNNEKKHKTSFAKQAAKINWTKNIEIKTLNILGNKGVITYDKVLELSFELIQYDILSNKISKRISHLFVDEYQDMHTYQDFVLQKIIQEKKTKFYCVGDPLQSIFKFMYGQTQIRIKNDFKVKILNDSPIRKMEKVLSSNVVRIKDNHRSSPSITNLISQYTNCIGYKQISKANYDYQIYFVDGLDKNAIIKKFYNISNELEIKQEPNKIKYLHLSQEWKFWDDVKLDLGINMIDKGNHRNSSLMSEIKRYILGVLGMNQKQVLELINENSNTDKLLSFRQFCIKAYKSIKNNDIENASSIIKKKFSESYGYKFPNDRKSIDKNTDVKNTLKELLKAEPKQSYITHNKFYSTIHSSKGLEATAVLVFATKKKQLFDWLNFANVLGENDNTRLGFVAFSRARKLLCISCLEKLTEIELKKLKKIGFEIKKTV